MVENEQEYFGDTQEPQRCEEEPEAKLRTLVREKKNICLTGKPGTGKSTWVRNYIKAAQDRGENVAVVAPTGIAAINVQGVTIHSFFRFKIGLLDEGYYSLGGNVAVMRALDTLVIDEISMVRADMLDAIDKSLQLYRDDEGPFGGVRVIAVGDPYQLPPVVVGRELTEYFRDQYQSPYFFDAHVWKQAFSQVVELTHVYRQTEQDFLEILDEIRRGDTSRHPLRRLNGRCFRMNPPLPEKTIILTSTNAIASSWNQRQLDACQGDPNWYSARIVNSFPASAYPAEEELVLKVGARVMFVRNDTGRWRYDDDGDRVWDKGQGRYVNGTCGTVTKLNADSVRVQVDTTEAEFWVESETWEHIAYEYEYTPVVADDRTAKPKRRLVERVTGTFTQLPLRLAWAITIHKSQGQTFDNVLIDLGRGAFAPGQTYVALSRCTTLAGITLKYPLQPHDLQSDRRVVEFYREQCGDVS